MSRFSKCLNFQIKRMLKSTIVFFAFYLAICTFLYIMFDLIFISNNNSSGSFNSSFSFTAAIFLFVYVITDYRSKTNYLIMFGNIRRNIFLTSFLSNAVMSVLLTAVSIAASFMESFAGKLLYKGSYSTPLLQYIYKDNSTGSEMLFMIALFLLITAVSTFYGAFAYKLGKVFSILFWVAFAMVFMISPLPGTINFLKVFFCYGVTNGILLASINLTAASLVLYAISYAVASRQPQEV